MQSLSQLILIFATYFRRSTNNGMAIAVDRVIVDKKKLPDLSEVSNAYAANLFCLSRERTVRLSIGPASRPISASGANFICGRKLLVSVDRYTRR
jgi:hypothetical protein